MSRSPSDFDPFHEISTILVKLITHCHGDLKSRVPTTTFAARVKVDTAKYFVFSLDHVCMERVRRMILNLGHYIGPENSQYEYISRRFVWQGIEQGSVSIAGLSDGDIQDQLHMMAKRGWQDHIEVEVTVTIFHNEPRPLKDEEKKGE
jgi:hypothetical protein